jgi:hypothetical protein
MQVEHQARVQNMQQGHDYQRWPGVLVVPLVCEHSSVKLAGLHSVERIISRNHARSCGPAFLEYNEELVVNSRFERESDWVIRDPL